MKTHADDPVLVEMHAIKDAISAEFGHDIDALFDHLQRVESQIRVRQSGATPSVPSTSPQKSVALGKRKPVRRPPAGAGSHPAASV